jgi:hypothetical protein
MADEGRQAASACLPDPADQLISWSCFPCHHLARGACVSWCVSFSLPFPDCARCLCRWQVSYNDISDIGLGLLSDMGCIYHLGQDFGTSISNNRCQRVESFNYGGWGL